MEFPTLLSLMKVGWDPINERLYIQNLQFISSNQAFLQARCSVACFCPQDISNVCGDQPPFAKDLGVNADLYDSFLNAQSIH